MGDNVQVVPSVVAQTRTEFAGLLRRASERLTGARLPEPIVLPEPPTEPDARALVIGRSMGCDLTLSDPTVSRWHAELVRDGERWVVRDMGSTNGTRVNGDVVSGDEVPKDGLAGALVQVGKRRFVRLVGG